MRLDIDEIASTTLSHLPKRKLNDVKVSGRGLLILWWLGSKRVLDRRSGRPGMKWETRNPPSPSGDGQRPQKLWPGAFTKVCFYRLLLLFQILISLHIRTSLRIRACHAAVLPPYLRYHDGTRPAFNPGILGDLSAVMSIHSYFAKRRFPP